MKQLFVFLFFWTCTQLGTAQTFYYELTKIIKNNVSSTEVSGGQFITFMADICYESTKNGMNVEHGRLEYSKGQSIEGQFKTYSGSSYWGNATFKFKSDLSKLNVITSDGDVWVYTRTTPPASATTCSLIRKGNTHHHSNSSGDYTLPPPVNNSTVIINNNSYNSGATYNSSNNGTSSSSNYNQTTTGTTRECKTCKGTGKSLTRISTPYYGGGPRAKEYCSICNGYYLPHYHNPCNVCYGNGHLK